MYNVRRVVIDTSLLPMSTPDLNLLVVLDVLLAEGSVALAARRLRLSPSAMSRALTRLRETTGDPLLVRAGRGLVATPRAHELRERVSQLVQDAHAALLPIKNPKLTLLARTFTLRTSDGFVENFGPSLVARVSKEAPNVRLHFLQKVDKNRAPLRDGAVDLETGVIDNTTGPEVRVRTLFRDHYIGVVRMGHTLCNSEITPSSYASGMHVVVSRQNLDTDQLTLLGLERRITTIVGGFSAALFFARGSDLIATVPQRHTETLRAGMYSFDLPIPTPTFTVSMLWHPRMDADPAHRWLRGCLHEVCAES
jgi:DNA-binding transcriptional LysR family regulator